MLSPRSRGKGSRRAPGRDGGRGRWKVAEWRKQAAHAVDDFPRESGSLVELTFETLFGRSPGEAIYLFDQQAARVGLRYQAELIPNGSISFWFVIRVPASAADQTRAIIERIGKR